MYHLLIYSVLISNFYFFLLSLQRYFAHFKIQHKMARATRGIQDSYQIINQKLRILGEIAVQAYIDDVKEMVRREIKAVKKDAGKHPHRHNVHWVKARWNNCNQWLKSDHPLSFGRDHNTINTLSRTVAEEDDDRIIAPLPLAREDSISPHSFASRLYNISLAQTRQAVVAPVWREGAAWHTLRVAVAHASHLLGEGRSDQDREKCFVKSLVDATLGLQVHYFPNKCGDHSGVPTIKSWTYLGKAPTLDEIQNSRFEDVGTNLKRRRAQAVTKIIQSSTSAPWEIRDLKIENFKHYMNRTVLAVDFSLTADGSAHGKKHVSDLYNWALDRFSSTKKDWMLRLAFHLGFLFAKVTPKVYTPAKGDMWIERNLQIWDVAIGYSTHKDSIEIARSLGWIMKGPESGPNKRGGVHDRALYCTQAAIHILLFIDPTSPLRRELEIKEKDRTIHYLKLLADRHGKFVLCIDIVHVTSVSLIGCWFRAEGHQLHVDDQAWGVLVPNSTDHNLAPLRFSILCA